MEEPSRYLLAAAASPQDLLRRQNAVGTHAQNRTARVREGYAHVQRALDRYVQDAVCQLEELAVAVPPRLRGAVDTTTPDNLRAVLNEQVQGLRLEIDQLIQRQHEGSSDTRSASDAFGAISLRLQELHALKQQTRALQERRSDLQRQLQVQRERRAALSATAALSDAVPAVSGRINSLKISTTSSVSGESEEASEDVSFKSPYPVSAGSSEVARRALIPQQIVDFDSPRLDSRARSLFSPTTDDAGKASGFDDSMEAFDSSWGEYASEDSMAVKSQELERPESPSLLVFSPNGDQSAAGLHESGKSRFFGEEASASSAKSIMELYPSRGAPPIFDVFSLAEDASFSALDAGNEIDENVYEAIPVITASAAPNGSTRPGEDSAKLTEVSVGQAQSSNPLDDAIPPSFSASFAGLSESPQKAATSNQTAQTAALQAPDLDFASFGDAGASSFKSELDADTSDFGAFGDWGTASTSANDGSFGELGFAESGSASATGETTITREWQPSAQEGFAFGAFGDFESALPPATATATTTEGCTAADKRVSAADVDNFDNFSNFEASFENSTSSAGTEAFGTDTSGFSDFRAFADTAIGFDTFDAITGTSFENETVTGANHGGGKNESPLYSAIGGFGNFDSSRTNSGDDFDVFGFRTTESGTSAISDETDAALPGSFNAFGAFSSSRESSQVIQHNPTPAAYGLFDTFDTQSIGATAVAVSSESVSASAAASASAATSAAASNVEADADFDSFEFASASGEAAVDAADADFGSFVGAGVDIAAAVTVAVAITSDESSSSAVYGSDVEDAVGGVSASDVASATDVDATALAADTTTSEATSWESVGAATAATHPAPVAGGGAETAVEVEIEVGASGTREAEAARSATGLSDEPSAFGSFDTFDTQSIGATAVAVSSESVSASAA
ncbi:hypothetical protein PybrP1_006061, partial [[Pythium] brassicae (nom. inval.)]